MEAFLSALNVFPLLAPSLYVFTAIGTFISDWADVTSWQCRKCVCVGALERESIALDFDR